MTGSVISAHIPEIKLLVKLLSMADWLQLLIAKPNHSLELVFTQIHQVIEEFKVGITSTYIELPTETSATLHIIMLSFDIDL